MSANLDLVRSLYAAWERGDFSAKGWAAPEIEWIVADGPTADRRMGIAEMEEHFRAMLGAWESFRMQADEYRELDGERVLVLTEVSGRGKTSGLDLTRTPAQGAHLLHIRGGQVTLSAFYWDRDRALADLGLAAKDSSR
jgi:ketosteroid isomerase-like protein